MDHPVFPITPLLPAVRDSLAAHPRLVLEAPPGAGKTTQVPLALLDAPWLHGRRIVMLEPRRVAARSAAGFMARQLGEEVGGTVGYRIRFEHRVSARTRIEVVTEGILTRMIQDDPELGGEGRDGVGALEQRVNHIAQEEENQGNCAEHSKPADKYIPAGQVIFKRADTALALQFRRIEINALGSGCRSHWGIGQIIHAHTLAVLYDRKMTKQ